MGTVDLTTAPSLLHKFWGIVLYNTVAVDCLGLTGQCLVWLVIHRSLYHTFFALPCSVVSVRYIYGPQAAPY